MASYCQRLDQLMDARPKTTTSDSKPVASSKPYTSGMEVRTAPRLHTEAEGHSKKHLPTPRGDAEKPPSRGGPARESATPKENARDNGASAPAADKPAAEGAAPPAAAAAYRPRVKPIVPPLRRRPQSRGGGAYAEPSALDRDLAPLGIGADPNTYHDPAVGARRHFDDRLPPGATAAAAAADDPARRPASRAPPGGVARTTLRTPDDFPHRGEPASAPGGARDDRTLGKVKPFYGRPHKRPPPAAAAAGGIVAERGVFVGPEPRAAGPRRVTPPTQAPADRVSNIGCLNTHRGDPDTARPPRPRSQPAADGAARPATNHGAPPGRLSSIGCLNTHRGDRDAAPPPRPHRAPPDSIASLIEQRK